MELFIDFILLSTPGVVLLYAGFWVADSAMDSQYYPRLIAWLLGGVIVMFGFIFLRDLHPGVTVEWSIGTQALALTIGSIGGLLIGIQETRATMQTEQLVTQTKKLEEYTDQLEEREQRLQRQNEQLEQFASVVSHDLRNPLNVAQARVELFREESDSEHIDPIDRSLIRMEELIEDLLTLARQGDQVSEFTATDIASLSDSCWANVATSDATLQVRMSHTLRADPSRVQQLLENLFRNAVEHGGDDVSVTVGDLDDGFYIEDDGPGIPEQNHDEIFSMGYSTATDGTGFGLSIVNQVVDAHGWTLRVTDGHQGGARFEITDVEFAE
ncbi:HAMP domain-containing sensor histidine kinase [Halorhabdus sp. CUG00001]|uniref:sensor histidine kinase n=1 Tax=Halorhabdus sp. CUG00001 TaxID=2600297 RepID=UPI00131E5191|nr:HAMP domain-containing sensor histidine kinase [Halorhabdus sp. CUG00001]